MNYGIHTDLPASVYHALPGASATKLKQFHGEQATPAKFKQAESEPFEPTVDMIYGSLCHSIILEPDKPLPGLVIRPDFYNGTSGEFSSGMKKPRGEEWKPFNLNSNACDAWRNGQLAAGLIPLKRDEYDAAFALARRVVKHCDAGPLLAKGRAEVSVVTHDASSGLDVRARIDFVPDDVPALVDIKTSNDACERGFEKRAYSLGYHIQAALYLDLWNSLMLTEPRHMFYFIAVENFAPFDLNVFVASEEFLSKGREDYCAALATYARCIREGVWAGYPEGIKSLGIPRYAAQ